MTLIQESDLPEAFLGSTGIPIQNKKIHKDCHSQLKCIALKRQTENFRHTQLVMVGFNTAG